MARRRFGRRRRGRGSTKLPIISAGIVAAQAYSAYAAAGGNLGAAASRFVSYYIAYEAHTNTWHPEHLLIGYGPWAVKRFVKPIVMPHSPKILPGISLS